jgi:hypothetical protein
MFAEAITPLAARRREDGFRAVVSTEPPGKALAGLEGRPRYILLVGDDVASGDGDTPWRVPARRTKLYRWRAAQREEFVSDAAWGDFDGDLVPEAPVGRIPARTVGHVRRAIDKILAYERRAPAAADLRFAILAGAPGYDATVNRLAMGMFPALVRRNAPAWSRPWLLVGEAGHALCGWPPDQVARFCGEMQRGAALACMMGHASADSFFSMSFRGETIEFTARKVQRILGKGKPSPPLIILACGCGDFTGRDDCLAESLLWMPGGPVAAVAATTESHPLTNYFSGTQLLRAAGSGHTRLGSLWLDAQKRAMKQRDFLIERLLRDVEGKLDDAIDVAKLRRDQMLMYALLGDPATRLKLPQKLPINVERGPAGWRWTAAKPKGAVRLLVGFRPAGGGLPPALEAVEKTAARRRLAAANAAFGFRPVVSLDATVQWKGTFRNETAGTLRFVALDASSIHAASVRLDAPEGRSPAATQAAPSEGG